MAGIIVNIAKNTFLRNTFFISLISSIIFPAYGIFVVMPSFTNQLMENIEEDAFRAGRHLTSMFYDEHKIEAGSFNSEAMLKKMERVKSEFQLERIKVFSNSGEIIYSTTNADIGKTNRKDYFYNIVSKGDIFSKIVKKNTRTLDGRTVEVDVFEIYIPIMKSGSFMGAFEIYRDITKPKKDLNRLLFRSSISVVATSLILLSIVIIMLLMASNIDIKRKKAEDDLKNANENLEDRVGEQTREIKMTQKMSIESLAILAEYYDQDTGTHLDRIQRYVSLLTTDLRDYSLYSKYLQSQPAYINEIVMASVLHDIGKTAIPKEILAKPGRLTKEEFSLMQKHTEIAGDVLDRANKTFVDHFSKDSYLALARDIALYHHERWDGKGYPFGLKGEVIPLSARIVALADVYDALRSRRPYKEPWTHKKAEAEIVKGRGDHFDPAVVDAFLANSEQFEAISSGLQHASEPAPDVPVTANSNSSATELPSGGA